MDIARDIIEAFVYDTLSTAAITYLAFVGIMVIAALDGLRE